MGLGSLGLGAGGGPVVEITTNGVVVLLRAAASGDPFAQDTLAYFCAVLLYLRQHAGYLPELTDQIADPLVRMLLRCPPSPAVSEGAQQALSCAVRSGREEHVRSLGEWCLRAASSQVDANVRVGLLFSAGLVLRGGSRTRWMTRLLSAWPAGTDRGLRLQVLVAAVEHDADAVEAHVTTLNGGSSARRSPARGSTPARGGRPARRAHD